ncbi:MAG: hypothetical protein JWR12_3183 [Mucilaginibacter sp.]|nr:hypothetical protein [Mucilaginibacter sp.]
MNRILSRIKYPLRFAEHISIKFLDKKIKQLPNLLPFFSEKKGLEIGGPSKIFSKDGYIPLYPVARSIDGVNFSISTVWENTIAEGKTYNFGSTSPGYQFIMDGTDLSEIKSEAYDFILSSHSLEHIANPLKALKEWLRVLKPGGILLIILPDSKFTFDSKRSITKLEHLFDDFNKDIKENDLTHFEEIISLHDLSYDYGIKNIDELKKRSMNNFTNRCLHHHVFDLNLMESIFKYFILTIKLKEVSPPFNLIMMGIKES